MEKRLKYEQHRLSDVRYWLKIEMHSSSITRKSNELTY